MLPIVTTLVIGVAAGVFKYLGNTIWDQHETQELVKSQVCTLFNRIINCDLANTICSIKSENSTQYSCFDGVNCLLFNQTQCTFARHYTPISRESFRISTITTIALTFIARIWIEKIPNKTLKNRLLSIPIGWMMESFFFLRAITGARGSSIHTSNSDSITNFSVALATNLIVHKFFLALHSRKSPPAELKNHHIKRSTIIQRSINEGRVKKIEGLSCGKLFKKNMSPIHTAELIIGSLLVCIGSSVPATDIFIARDFGLILSTHAIGVIVERIFHDLWLLEEHKLEDERKLKRFSPPINPSSTENRLQDEEKGPTHYAINLNAKISPPKKLTALRVTSSLISAGGAVLSGFLFSVDSPYTLPFIGLIGGVLLSRSHRAFIYRVKKWTPMSTSRCEKIINVFGRIVGIGTFISILSLWQSSDQWLERDISDTTVDSRILAHNQLGGFLPTTAILAAAPFYLLGRALFTEKGISSRNRFLRFLKDQIYYPDLFITSFVYGINRYQHLEKYSYAAGVYKTAGYATCGVIIFLHRGIAASNFCTGEIFMNGLSPFFAGGVLSWYMGIAPYDSLLAPPLTLQ